MNESFIRRWGPTALQVIGAFYLLKKGAKLAALGVAGYAGYRIYRRYRARAPTPISRGAA